MQRFLHSMSAWLGDWKPYFRSRIRQAASRVLEHLQFAAFVIFICVAIFNILAFFSPYSEVLFPPGVLERVVAMFTLICLGLIGLVVLVFFAVVFILSLHPKTRKWADRHFHFKDLTELEELKARVDTIESGLASTNERIDKQLEEINSRLGSIEATLKSLASKDSRTKRHSVQKSKQKRTR